MSVFFCFDICGDVFCDVFFDMFCCFMCMIDWFVMFMVDDMWLDVVENDKEYQVCVEIFGVRKEDIYVNVQGNYVIIDVEVKFEKKELCKGNGECILLQEMYYGSSSCCFVLFQEVDLKNVNVYFENGVFSLILFKVEFLVGSSIKVQ